MSKFSFRFGISVPLPSLLLLVLLVITHNNPALGDQDPSTAMRHYKSFPGIVSNAAGCKICEELVMNALVQVETYKVAKALPSVSSMETEDILDTICDPYSQDGAWIRRIIFSIDPDVPLDANSPVHLNVTASLSGFKYCKRTCSTVQETCQFITENPTFDSFPGEVAKRTNDGPLITAAVADSMIQKYCAQYFMCVQWPYFQKILTEKLHDPDVTLRADIEGDTSNDISREELAVQFQNKRKEKTTLTNKNLQHLQFSVIDEGKNHTEDPEIADL